MCVHENQDQCHNTKNKLITLANRKGHKQSNEPIKTLSKYL